MSAVFIVGELVVLSPLDKQFHLDSCYQWFNDQDVIRYLLTDCLPVTFTAELTWFEGLQSSQQVIFAVLTKADRKYVGNVGLHQIDWVSRTARTVTIIGDKTEWRKGFGTEATKLVVSYAFNNLNLRKLTSQTLKSNMASRRMVEKCGFKKEGYLKAELYRDGNYHDLMIFGLSEADWRTSDIS